MILINVLAIIAAAAAVVMLMIGTQDRAIELTTGLRQAAQALAAARGGELSALVALRRDAIAAPGTDNATEAWAKVAQAKTAIVGGSFTLAISDAQARFNVNAAPSTGEPVLAAIATSLGLPADVASRISVSIGTDGPIADLGELQRAGIDAPTIAALRPLVTALPGKTEVNVNSASADMLAILLGNPLGARILVDRRDRAGLLMPADFIATGLPLPAGAGYTSDHYTVVTTVTIGDTSQTLTSLLERRRDGDKVSVVVLSRSRGQ